MSRETVCLTLEPYVYVSMHKSNVFLYNTLNATVLESASPPVINLVKRLCQGNNLQVIKLDWGQVNRIAQVRQFIEKARRRFMVDIIPGQRGGNKAVQFMPMIGLKKETKEKSGVYSFAKQGMTYLKEISIFINGECERDCSICFHAYKQFPCCHRTAAPHPSLNLESIKRLLAETPSLTKINILGGNILKYSEFPALIKFLNETDPAKTFYIHYLNLVPGAVDLDIFSQLGVFLNILVPFPVSEKELEKTFLLIDEKKLNFNFVFILQSGKELIQAQEIAKKFSIRQFYLSPFFNGKNKTFFKTYIYVKKKMILSAKPTIKEIFSRSVINRNYFGKLVILSNGDVHTNINEKPSGNIRTGSLRKILYNELQGSKSWLKTRDKIKPCRECHYRFLCPSISNYDYAIGKHNLCTIWKVN